ncbi:MAG: ATP-binding cassette domain-containing protein, partial [Paraclostridium sp.]
NKNCIKEFKKNDSDKKTHMSESINNIDIVKTFELQDKNFEFIGNLQNISTDLNKKNSKIIGFSSFLFSFGSILSYTIVLSIAVYGLALKNINIAEFTVLLQLYRQIQTPISQLQSYIPVITNIMAAVDRIFEIDILDSEKVNQDKKAEFRKNIKLDNISLEYENGSKVLKNLSLKICKGDIVGIIGDSGAGKSTFLKAILNIIDTSKGEIFIDDEILNASHRSLMSYVPQDDMLFSMSIKENLLYLDKDLNYSEIEKALKLTKANEFIDKLPNGIDTNVNLLSKGQRQRISLARAILKKSPILILDEITSALDIETEEYIINSIKTLAYKPTCIIVTHRKPILSICNKVYKIDQSSITSKVSA